MIDDDRDLNRALDTLEVTVRPDRLRAVRTAILVGAHNSLRFSFMSAFAFRPALVLATALVGFILGVSLPTQGIVSSDATATVLDEQPQSFLTGDLG